MKEQIRKQMVLKEMGFLPQEHSLVSIWSIFAMNPLPA